MRDLRKLYQRTRIPDSRDITIGEMEQLFSVALSDSNRNNGIYKAICMAYSAGYEAGKRKPRRR